MSATLTYTRPAAVVTASTPIVVTAAVAEKPGVPVVIPATTGAVDAAHTAIAAASGSTGNISAIISVDVDESGGASVKQIFRVETAFTLSPAGPGAFPIMTVTVTPINPADQTDMTPVVLPSVPFPMSMDAFQTAAGRVRQ